VPLITSLGSIFPGILAIFLVRKHFGIKFNFQKFSQIKEHLHDGYHLFTSTLAISAYTLSTTVILGLLTNNQVVGYFSAADKIIQAAKSLYQPISYAMYPAISLLVSSDRKRGLAWLTKIGYMVSISMLIVSACIFLFASQIVVLFYGKDYLDSVVLLRTMSFLPFIISISNMLGVQTMLTFGYAKEFFKILLVAALLGLFLNVSLVRRYEAFGASLALLIVESFVTFSMLAFVKKKLFNKST
jgi:PST family polysaccharide transporter